MLKIRGLSKKFDGNYVLKNINMEIQAGKVYGLIGANGSGKSTLMNILNGHAKIAKSGGYEGQIYINGEAVQIKDHLESLRHGISMVHQELALFSGMSVTENIKINKENVKGKGFLIPELALLDQQKNEGEAAQMLAAIGSEVSPRVSVEELSLNQKQFVEIARELDNDNIHLLILDEPTSSLNITETQKLLTCVREIAAKGIAVIFISHRLGRSWMSAIRSSFCGMVSWFPLMKKLIFLWSVSRKIWWARKSSRPPAANTARRSLSC